MEESTFFQNKKTEEFASFVFYCITFVGCGAVITGLGPLIPFFAAREGYEATEYSFIFFWRAVGYCVGSVLCKIWERHYTFHFICLASSVVMGFCLIMFSWVPNMHAKAFVLLLASIMNATLDIFVNMSIIESKKNDNLDKWLQINHGAFGIGGLIGPLLVYWFEEWSFAVIAVIFLVSAPAYRLLATPEKDCIEVESVRGSILGKNKLESNTISFKTNLLLCTMFMLLIGEQSAFGGWVSAYAVINGIQTKQDATFYGSVFWVAITVFRFIFLILPGRPSSKSIWMYLGSIFMALSSLILLHGWSSHGHTWIIYSSIGFGMFFSIVFPLLLSTPKEFQINLSPSDNSNFMIAASLGQGTIAVITGYSMDWFGPDMLFYSLLAVNIFIVVGHSILIKRLREQTYYCQSASRSDALSFYELSAMGKNLVDRTKYGSEQAKEDRGKDSSYF